MQGGLALWHARTTDHRSADWNDAIMHSKKSQRFAISPCSWLMFSNLGIFSPRSCLTDIEDFYVATSICWLGKRSKPTFPFENPDLAGYLEVKEGSYAGIINMINRCQRPVGRYPFWRPLLNSNDRVSILLLTHSKFGGTKISMGVFPPLAWPTK